MLVSNQEITQHMPFKTVKAAQKFEEISSTSTQHDIAVPRDETAVIPFNNWPNDQGFDADHEEHDPIELGITGNIPAYAAGTLYRIGPGGYRIQTANGSTISRAHWFDGFSQAHRFQIVASTDSKPETRVFYNSRRTVDELVENIRKTGSFQGFSFAQKRDPCQSYFKKIMSIFTPAEANPQAGERNVGVTLSINMAGLPNTPRRADVTAPAIDSLYAKTDANLFQQIHPETLKPIGLATQQNLNKKLKGPMSAAHAKSDPLTGDVFNYNLELGRKATYRVFRVSAVTAKTEILATITNVQAAYIHSLLLTANYVILCVWGSHYAKGGAMILWEKNILDAIADFDSTKRTVWYVIDRKHSKGVVATYMSDAFFCFHTINAWEERSLFNATEVDIIADLTVYENLDVLKRFYYDNLISTSPAAHGYAGKKGDTTRGCVKRFRLPSVTTLSLGSIGEAEVMWTIPKSQSAELPTLNPKYMTRKHRYIYGVADRGHSTFLDGLVKVDAQSQQSLFWQKHGHSPGEAIFIPDPQGEREDDGVLLSVVLDGFEERSYLLCLDAKSMTEVGKANLETAVGFGFHGSYVSARANGPIPDY